MAGNVIFLRFMKSPTSKVYKITA